MLENKEEHSLQNNLFKYILKNFDQPKVAIAELCEILRISQSSVYKRIQGTKRITSDEIAVLIDHYNISPHVLFQTSGSNVIFDFPPLLEKPSVTGSYLAIIKDELQRVADAPHGSVLYASSDLPFFYYFLQPEVAWLKLYLFQHNSSNTAINQLPKISFSAIGEEQQQLFDDIKTLYSRIDSEEIWTSRAFRITVDQIRYFVDANLFQDQEEALILMDKLELMADQLLEMVNKNSKSMMGNLVAKGGRFNLSYNDFNRFNPIILATTQSKESLYITYSLPYYLYTEDSRFIEYTQQWMQRVKRKAFSISENAEIEQMLFFSKIKNYIREEKRMMKDKFYRAKK